MSKRIHERYSRPYKRGATGDRKTENVRARFEDRHTLEEISGLFQIFIAELEQMNVARVDGCSLYFSAYDGYGRRMALPNEHGEPLKFMTIGYKRPDAPKTNVPEVTCSYGARKF